MKCKENEVTIFVNFKYNKSVNVAGILDGKTEERLAKDLSIINKILSSIGGHNFIFDNIKLSPFCG